VVKLARLRRFELTIAGREYELVLTPERPLTPEEIKKALEGLRAQLPRVEKEYYVNITGMRVEPNRVIIRYKARVMGIPLPGIALTIGAILAGILGITFITWKTSEMVAEIPWELIMPVAALGIIAFIVWKIV